MIRINKLNSIEDKLENEKAGLDRETKIKKANQFEEMEFQNYSSSIFIFMKAKLC